MGRRNSRKRLFRLQSSELCLVSKYLYYERGEPFDVGLP